MRPGTEAPGLNHSKRVSTSAGGMESALPRAKASARPVVRAIRKLLPMSFKPGGALRPLAGVDEPAGHGLERRPQGFVERGIAGEDHGAGALQRVLRAHEDGRVDVGDAALLPALDAGGDAACGGGAVVDDDRAAGKPKSARSSTSSTAASSERVRCTRAAPRTASAGSSKTVAPSGSRALALAAVRFQTFTVSPRLSSARTKFEPSSPMPRKAIMGRGDSTGKAGPQGDERTSRLG